MYIYIYISILPLGVWGFERRIPQQAAGGCFAFRAGRKGKVAVLLCALISLHRRRGRATHLNMSTLYARYDPLTFYAHYNLDIVRPLQAGARPSLAASLALMRLTVYEHYA